MHDLLYLLSINLLFILLIFRYFRVPKNLLLRLKPPFLKFLLWASRQLQLAGAFLAKKAGSSTTTTFRNLAAFAKVDLDDPYIKLLQQCVQDTDTKNIALTGPYGSGKSSILRSFQLTHPEYHYLNISLASFKGNKEQAAPPVVPGNNAISDAGETPKIASIEYSILQQLFYHVRHQQIPFSRFKRIKNLPGGVLLFRSVALVCWAAAVAYLIWHEKIFTTAAVWKAYFTWPPDVWKMLLLAFAACGACYACYIVLRLYNNSKFHKFNLTSGEVEIAPASDASILNRHLDELLYFFEATRYNVLIIEDLDRFDDPEVFVRLRELNNLLNYSRQVGRKISFIYALKDDVFRDEQRTKFFDYIIPVIPVIDHQNSSEKFSDRLAELDIDRSNIPASFISDVAAYISDMRLLLNTVNEFQLYRTRLHTTAGSYGQLLAMMIFKNKYPKLFAQLHRRKGIAFKVLNGKERFVEILSQELLDKKAQLESQIKTMSFTFLRDKKELRLAYIGRIIESLTDFGGQLYIEHNSFDLKTLTEDDQLFAQFTKVSNIRYYKASGYAQHIGHSFAVIEKQVDPIISYQQREHEVALRQKYKSDELQQELKKVQLQLDHIRAYRLADIFAIRSLPELDAELGKNSLLNYLVSNDYLNEDYNYYLSHFYPGSLTQRDYDFFFAVKEKRRLSFDTALSQTEELINRLDISDFGHPSILNITLVDTLLAQPADGNDRLLQLSSLFNPADTVAGTFIHDYFRLGKQQAAFMRLLALWPRFWLWVSAEDQLTSETRRNYLGLLLQQAPLPTLTAMNQQDCLKGTIEEMPDFLTWCQAYLVQDQTRAILKHFNISFFMLDAQATQEPLFNDVLENFWYQLNPMMVELIVGHFSLQDELPVKLRTQNLTTIMVADIPVLLDYVHEYPGYYVDNVFNELPDNTMESEAAISYLVKEEEISLEKRVRVLEKSERRLATIDKAPPELWPEVLRLSRIVATWANLYPVYAAGKSITAEMAAFMNLPENYAQLAKAKLAEVSGVEEKMLEAFGLKVLVSPAIAVPAKRQLLPQLGFYYTDPDLSALNREQVEVILSADRLNFSVETYQFLQASHAGLQLVYAENNLESFFDELENLALKNLDYRLLLASERLSSTQHEILIQKLDFGELAHDPELTAIVARLLLRTGFMPSIAQSKLLSVFSYSEDNDLRKHLLLKYLPTLSEAQTGELLSQMSEDYVELPNYRQPKMADTLLNKSLLSALQIKGYYVSSFPEKKGRLNVYTKSRPAE